MDNATARACMFGMLLLTVVYAAEMAYVSSIMPDVCEDAYITFRFSKNFADGHGPVFNPGERVEGYSNALWMAALAAAHRLGLDMASASRMAGALFNSLSFFLVWLIPRRLFSVRGWSSLAAPLLYVFFLPLQFYAASGLETSLFIFLVTVGAACLVWAGRSAGRCTAAFCVLLLAALTRPEGLLYAVFFCGWCGWRAVVRKESLRPFMPGMVLFGLLYGAFLAWRLGYYGLLMPNTYYAKASFPLYVRLVMGFFNIKGFLANYVWLALLAPLFFCVKIPDPRQGLPVLGLFIAAGGVFGLAFSGWDWMPYFRYLLPVVPLVLVCCSLLCAGLCRSRARFPGGRLLPAAAAAIVLTLAGEQYWKDFAFTCRWNEISRFARFNQQAMGEFFRREIEPRPLIAIGDVGYFAYISQTAVIDLYGITSREFAEIKKTYGAPDLTLLPFGLSFDRLKRKEVELLVRLAPDYVFLYNSRLKIVDTYPVSAAGIADNPLFRNSYDYLTSFSIIPDFTSPIWPRSIHVIDALDLSTGMFSWMRTGWGYDVYIRRDSRCPRFVVELGADERIHTIRLLTRSEQ